MSKARLRDTDIRYIHEKLSFIVLQTGLALMHTLLTAVTFWHFLAASNAC